MNKPVLTKFETFAINTLQMYDSYLPNAFDESLTILQKMNKLIEYLNRMGLLMNDVVEQWNEVMEWVMNDGLTDAVSDKLDQMVEDGTLARILAQLMLQEYVTKVELDKILKSINGIAESRQYLYVDDLRGDDKTANGSQLKPFKTIQACLDSIPKVINQDRFIMIEPGTYNEDARIKSVSGSAIYLQTNRTNIPYKVKSLEFLDINGLVRVENAEFFGTDKQFNVRYSRCNYATTNTCYFYSENLGSERIAIEFDGTNGSVNSSKFKNQFTCIFSQNGSNVRVDSTNDILDTTTLRAVTCFAGHVYFNGDVPFIDKAKNPITVRYGGRTTWDRGVVQPALENGWRVIETGNQSSYEVKLFKTDDNLIVVSGVVTGGAIGEKNIFKLPEGYKPVFSNHVFNISSETGVNHKIVIDRTGQVQAQTGDASPISFSGVMFYSGR